jgi:hypothetical protein
VLRLEHAHAVAFDLRRGDGSWAEEILTRRPCPSSGSQWVRECLKPTFEDQIVCHSAAHKRTSGSSRRSP